MPKWITRVWKAIVAGAGAGVAATVEGMKDGQLDERDYITIVGSVAVVGFFTWLVPNSKPAEPQNVKAQAAPTS